jgi:hypothetical protein
MTKTFVAISDPIHSLLRSLTRHIPLRAGFSQDQRVLLQYNFREQDLPEAYYSLAMFHAMGGMSLDALRRRGWQVRAGDKASIPDRINYFDAVKLDRRCARDLRLKLKRHGPGLLAGELLCFGTGTLRARNDDPIDRIHHYLWSQYGRLQTRHEVIHARIGALHWNSLPPSFTKQKESYDSTNVIYGDAFGELEQLWERRADTVFLSQVAAALLRMHRQAEMAAFLQPPLNLGAVMNLHLRCQGIWKYPPRTAPALLQRVEYILSNTIVDHSPTTIFRRPALGPESHPGSPASGSRSWRADRSGYDGWLAEDTADPGGAN